MSVSFNIPQVNARLQTNLLMSQVALDMQVLKDSNYYAPFKEGQLIASGIKATRPGQGIVDWNVDYASDQYYGFPNKNKMRNPNAVMKWFEVAKAKNLDSWLEISRKGGGFSG